MMTADLPALKNREHSNSTVINGEFKNSHGKSGCSDSFKIRDNRPTDHERQETEWMRESMKTSKTAMLDRMKTSLPDESVFKVDHKHYEQWARVPGKTRMSNSLLRGMQQLRSKFIREGREDEWTGLQELRRNYVNGELRREQTFYQSRETGDSSRIRREKTSLSVDSGELRKQMLERNTLRTNSQLIDSGVFVKECSNFSERHTSEKDQPKPRHGMSKLRDRCALPVSIYQPVSIGDHVFLINEPYSTSERKRNNGDLVKKIEKNCDKQPYETRLPDLVGVSRSTEMEAIIEKYTSVSRTNISEQHTIKQAHRTSMSVSNAEVCDFSQLANTRHSMTNVMFKRSKTDIGTDQKQRNSKINR